MKIYNIHERPLHAQPDDVGKLIDSLSGPEDQLWPRKKWPAMEFDAGLCPGARGGHGPIRYHVADYIPGERVVFQFDDSGLIGGFDGRHLFEAVPRQGHVVLRHIVDAECSFKLWLKWHLLVGPMHNALLEDSLDQAENVLADGLRNSSRWSLRVRFLRWMIARKRKKD
ncbi:MAG: SRPBCC family protein [Deltaproteobacteria bacterium]|nr:SRPBCC family protein [Deltaproteobacteria bacterium]MBN2686915.1 SRPBCC family protein [Deltaproteobacteria bacterium]